MTELPKNLRIPLHELQADVGYLVGRIVEDRAAAPMISVAIRSKLDLVETASHEMLDSAEEALIACEEYLDNRADADCDQDGFVPNREMILLSTVKTALAALQCKATS